MKAIFYEDFKNSYIPHILKEIYIDKVYHPFFKGKKDMVILDVGANINLFTAFAYPYAKKIYAIEPSKEHVETMKENLKYNKMEDKVEIIQKALSHQNGETTFYHNTNKTMYSLRGEVKDKEDSVEEVVETIRLDTLFAKYNIDRVDFLKLDVEGSECEVVGGEGFEKVAKRIDSLVVEYHKWSGVNPSQLVTTLEDYGFEMKHIPADAVLFGGKRR